LITEPATPNPMTTTAEAPATTQNTGTELAVATPTTVEAWTGTNLAGDTVETGIKKNRPEFHEDLRWWYRYTIDRKISQSEAATQLGVDGGTYSKVLRGEYKNPSGQLLPPPAKMISRIRVIREQEKTNSLKLSAGRVMTETVRDIHNVCRKAWRDRLIAFVFGESHIGKTFGAKWFRDENNHGATLYVDLQGIGGEQDLYREFARALGLSPDTPVNKLKPRVMAAIDRTNLVLVDEFHHITYAYQKGASIKMVNALKSIKDRTGCAMVIFATDVGRDEIQHGRESKLLKQLDRRGVIKLQLPAALRVADVRAIVEAYGLPFPPAPEKGADLWKALEMDHADFEGRQLCERIAYNHGIEHLVSVLKDGGALARKSGRELRWSDVINAQKVYDYQSAPKAV
jgi:DNA transposition AAA+ family ATPase